MHHLRGFQSSTCHVVNSGTSDFSCRLQHQHTRIETMAASMSLAKNVMLKMCKAFPNASASPSSLRCCSKISKISFATSASKNPWNGNGGEANRDPRPDLAYEDAKERAKEGSHDMKEKAKEYAEATKDAAEESSNRAAECARAAKEKVNDYAHDAKDKAKEGTERAADSAKEMKEKTEDVAGAAADKAKEGTSKATETAQNIGEKAKQTVQGAWEAAKDTTQKIKETVMGSKGEEDKEIEDDKRRGKKVADD